MKRLILLLAAAGCCPAVFAQEWQIDTAHSAAQFSVRHMMVANVRGHFGKLTGTVNYDPAKPAETKIKAEIDVSTIDTRQQKRDDHLRSADFFDVAKYPSMTFVSTKVEPDSGGKAKVHGDLTIRGVTKPVVWEVDSISEPIKDPRGGHRMGATATTKINRKDFGMTWNRMIEAGGVSVGDEVTITVDVELTKAK